MAATEYTYSISGDFPDGEVNTSKLTYEIQTSSIVTALDHIGTSDGYCSIWFKAALSSGDETTLDGIVAAHYPTPWNALIEAPDGKQIVQNTARVRGTRCCYTGEGDCQNSAVDVGGGDPIYVHHEVGGANPEMQKITFKTIENETWVYEAMACFEGAVFDRVHMCLRPKKTNYVAGENTYYNLYGGYLIVPAAGNGTIQVATGDRVLVQALPTALGVKPAAYWNADWNTTTKQFENIVAAPGGDGDYNMFGEQVQLACLARGIPVSGTCSSYHLDSNDVDRIPHGTEIWFGIETRPPDHEWKIAVGLIMYRAKTIGFVTPDPSPSPSPSLSPSPSPSPSPSAS